MTTSNSFFQRRQTLSRNCAPPCAFPFTQTNTLWLDAPFKNTRFLLARGLHSCGELLTTKNTFAVLLPCWAQEQKFPRAKMFEQVSARTRVDKARASAVCRTRPTAGARNLKRKFANLCKASKANYVLRTHNDYFFFSYKPVPPFTLNS